MPSVNPGRSDVGYDLLDIGRKGGTTTTRTNAKCRVQNRYYLRVETIATISLQSSSARCLFSSLDISGIGFHASYLKNIPPMPEEHFIPVEFSED
jgi:hypothetical protein